MVKGKFVCDFDGTVSVTEMNECDLAFVIGLGAAVGNREERGYDSQCMVLGGEMPVEHAVVCLASSTVSQVLRMATENGSAAEAYDLLKLYSSTVEREFTQYAEKNVGEILAGKERQDVQI